MVSMLKLHYKKALSADAGLHRQKKGTHYKIQKLPLACVKNMTLKKVEF